VNLVKSNRKVMPIEYCKTGCIEVILLIPSVNSLSCPYGGGVSLDVISSLVERRPQRGAAYVVPIPEELQISANFVSLERA
jgi:hypothetical protein